MLWFLWITVLRVRDDRDFSAGVLSASFPLAQQSMALSMADRNQPCCSRGELNDFVYLQIIPAVKLLSGGVVPALLTVAAGGDPCDALKCAIKRSLG